MATTYHSVAVRVLILFFLPIGAAQAQYAPQRLDSVVHALDPTVQDTDQLNLLILAADSWFTSEKAYPYLNRMDTLSSILMESDETAIQQKADRSRGYYHYYIGYHAKFERRMPLALRSFQESLGHLERVGHKALIAEVHDAMGVLLRAAGDPRQAMRSFQKELVIARDRESTRQIIQSLVHLAACHGDLNAPAKAHAFLDSCSGGSNAARSMVLNERARIFELDGRQEEAQEALVESLQLASETGNEWDKLPVLAPLARWYLQQEDLENGERTAAECTDVAMRMNDHTIQCGCMVLEADAAIAQRNYAEAEDLLLQAMKIAKSTLNVGTARETGDEGSQVSIALRLKGIYASNGRYQEANAMADLWSAMQDSVQRMNGRDEIMTMEFQKELFKDSVEHASDIRVRALEHEKQLAEERSTRTKWILAGGMLSLLLILFWFRYRAAQRSKRTILRAQELLVESEKRLKAEEVRTRIAGDVHDQLGSDLTKLVLLSEEARRSASEDPTALSEVARSIEKVASEANRSLGDIVWSVDPESDTSVDLVDHIRSSTIDMLRTTAMEHTIDCKHEEKAIPLDAGTRRDVHLLVREALNNSLKHANAAHVGLTCVVRSGYLNISIKDDGRGYDPDQAKGKGYGTANMIMRAERVGGVLNVDSAPGKGTHIAFSLHLI